MYQKRNRWGEKKKKTYLGIVNFVYLYLAVLLMNWHLETSQNILPSGSQVGHHRKTVLVYEFSRRAWMFNCDLCVRSCLRIMSATTLISISMLDLHQNFSLALLQSCSHDFFFSFCYSLLCQMGFLRVNAPSSCGFVWHCKSLF